MKHELKRQLNAWLLLLAFVPAMAIAVFHVHDDASTTEASCLDCVNHQAHAGHFTNSTGHLHDCVLCQLLQVTFLATESILLFHFLFHYRLLVPRLIEADSIYDGSILNSRAPPIQINN